MDGINAGRKTIPFARFDKERTKQVLEVPAVLPHRVGREGAGPSRRRPNTTGPRTAQMAGGASPTREPEEQKVPIGLPLPDMEQFMDIEDSWSMREERV